MDCFIGFTNNTKTSSKMGRLNTDQLRNSHVCRKVSKNALNCKQKESCLLHHQNPLKNLSFSIFIKISSAQITLVEARRKSWIREKRNTVKKKSREFVVYCKFQNELHKLLFMPLLLIFVLLKSTVLNFRMRLLWTSTNEKQYVRGWNKNLNALLYFPY